MCGGRGMISTADSTRLDNSIKLPSRTWKFFAKERREGQTDAMERKLCRCLWRKNKKTFPDRRRRKWAEGIILRIDVLPGQREAIRFLCALYRKKVFNSREENAACCILLCVSANPLPAIVRWSTQLFVCLERAFKGRPLYGLANPVLTNTCRCVRIGPQKGAVLWYILVVTKTATYFIPFNL